MRPIEFRAWDKDSLKMIYLDFKNVNPHLSRLNVAWFSDRIQDERAELMQFTGLTDKNGKKIWEGDILLTPGKFKMVVQIDNIGYGDPKFFNIGFDICEIIGNIYENPGLLK